MPRRAKRDLESSYLHVIMQGIEKRYIFEKEIYKKELRKLLVKKSEKFNVKILAYCIMDNHAHILLFSPQIENIGKYMKSVNTSFARMYNKAEQRKIEVQKCRTDDEYIKESLRLKKMGISNRKIAELLKIGRNKVNKIMKNMCQ